MEGEGEVVVVQECGSLEEGREHVAVGGDAEGAHGVEGGEGEVGEVVGGVAFDEGGPREWGRGRREGPEEKNREG